jgi:hypothetical protein
MKHSRSPAISVILLMLVVLTAINLPLLAGCGGGNPSSTTSSTSTGKSFSRDIQPIFNNNCVTCHQGQGTGLPSSMSLEPSKSYANLVGVQSTESAEMRVKAGAPDQSYLIAKLNGTQVAAGGSGAQMPLGSSPLPQSQIDLISQWITNGALNN